ncbi:type I restriction enzyme HsdR N-terminal domain-containing protein [Catalinimonas niigatensis]|uniref:type I restriction enzyme HsdR N-terminal domain-containing protein n=1 Tax=Catalinimonas niigatensis TaxID=1397264 RepID=UPI002667153C|nr:type I restriction enzyme HsdR N-terminal domain-containing protein [Catalinimonas niigatensis]WPP53198.1 type I restriction enzyme HsdR N-terminal domain-containing protein [Catalinimonas niigatensis]
MVNLNLPSFAHKVQKVQGKAVIFDIVRKKYVALTPEEWVRQHLLHFLINHLAYPKALIKVEGGLKYNTLAKRTDLVIFDRHGKPLIVVECKSFKVPISQKVFEQSSLYNSTLQASYLLVSNGIEHYCCRVNHQTKSFSFLDTLPRYEEIL